MKAKYFSSGIFQNYLVSIPAKKYINPIQDLLFWCCSRMCVCVCVSEWVSEWVCVCVCVWMGGRQKGPLPKICHIYPTMIKSGIVIPYLGKIQKLYEWRDKPLEVCWHVLPEMRNFAISRNTDTDCILINKL